MASTAESAVTRFTRSARQRIVPLDGIDIRADGLGMDAPVLAKTVVAKKEGVKMMQKIAPRLRFFIFKIF
ncbi:MAG: hypothetical protein FJX00_02335 [Alphaproteobacteria bacterium]|nr:hypothetical protein [Alphaproteobacteria bacterium]